MINFFSRKPSINKQRFFEQNGTWFETTPECGICGQPGASCVSDPCPYTSNARGLKFNPKIGAWYRLDEQGQAKYLSTNDHHVWPDFQAWLSTSEDWQYYLGKNPLAHFVYQEAGHMRYDEDEMELEGYWGDYTEFKPAGSLPVPRSPTPPPPPKPEPQRSKRGGFGRKTLAVMTKKQLARRLHRARGTRILVILRRVVS